MYCTKIPKTEISNDTDNTRKIQPNNQGSQVKTSNQRHSRISSGNLWMSVTNHLFILSFCRAAGFLSCNCNCKLSNQCEVKVKCQVPVGKFKNTSRASNAFSFSFFLTHIFANVLLIWPKHSEIRTLQCPANHPTQTSWKHAYWFVAMNWTRSEAAMNEHRKALTELKCAPWPD